MTTEQMLTNLKETFMNNMVNGPTELDELHSKLINKLESELESETNKADSEEMDEKTIPFRIHNVINYLRKRICPDRRKSFTQNWMIKLVNGYQIFEIRSDISLDSSTTAFNLPDEVIPKVDFMEVDKKHKIFTKRLEALEFATEYVPKICRELIQKRLDADGLPTTDSLHLINTYDYQIYEATSEDIERLLRVYENCENIPSDMIYNTIYVLDVYNTENGIFAYTTTDRNLIRRFLLCKQQSNIACNTYHICIHTDGDPYRCFYDEFCLPIKELENGDIDKNSVYSDILSEIADSLNEYTKTNYPDVHADGNFVVTQFDETEQTDEEYAGSIAFHGKSYENYTLHVSIKKI